MSGDVRLEPATLADLPAIVACVRRFRLDDEDLAAEQFVVARERGRLVAFGRIKPYGRVYELGSVGVLEAERGRGLGGLIVRELVRRFPTREVYITTDLPAYFARCGTSAGPSHKCHSCAHGPRPRRERASGAGHLRRRAGLPRGTRRRAWRARAPLTAEARPAQRRATGRSRRWG